MSELKAFITREGFEAYHKSEADKVIAHQKYKRCLAMAEWCHILTNYGPEETSDFYDKWTYIWQELAEKFKEAK